MAVARAAHVVNIGAAKVAVMLPDEYEANGSAISSVVGVTKVTATTTIDITVSVRALMQAGQVAKLRIAFKVNGRRKTADIICDLDKSKTAITSLKGKNFRGHPIISAYIPTHVRFG